MDTLMSVGIGLAGLGALIYAIRPGLFGAGDPRTGTLRDRVADRTRGQPAGRTDHPDPGARGGLGRSRGHNPDRPWRRLGAGICAVLALMFLLGVYAMDPAKAPRAYMAYWTIILLLVLWLLTLALKDLRYTHRRYTGMLDRAGDGSCARSGDRPHDPTS